MQLLRNISGFGGLLDWAIRLMEPRYVSCPSGRSYCGFSEGKTRISDDAALVSAALSGRSESVETLVRRVKPEIFVIARMLVGTHHDTADQAEKIFLRVFQLLKHYRPETPLIDWTIRAAISAGICELSSHGWAKADSKWTGDDVRILETIDAQGDGVTSAEAAQLLNRMLDHLTPAERLVKRLHDLEDHSFQVICKWTGWSEAKVNRIAESARKRMDALLIEICSVAS